MEIAADTTLVYRGRPGWLTLTWGRLTKSPATLLGLIIILISLLLAIVGPWMAPYGFAEQIPADRLQAPSGKHWFGTDQYGRDIASRIIVGSRDIYQVAGAAALLSALLGTAIGLLAGYTGGWFDDIVMRLLDVLLSIPPILLGMILLGMTGPSRISIILVIGFLKMPSVARVVRSDTLALKSREFVEAAKLQGESTARILFQEILPNALPALAVETSMRFCYAIFIVASFGFLGVGLQPPSPDWGLMVSEARDWFSQAPWMLLFPAGAICVLVLGVSLATDGIRQILRPNMMNG
jgi:peptide/nickel transport system permease protein